MTLYLAYGSNLNVKQMDLRCPSAFPICVTELSDYRLTFRSRYSRDGAWCNIESCEGAKIYGVIWELEQEDEDALDKYEGFPHQYTKIYIPMMVGPYKEIVMTYQMNEDVRWLEGVPSDNYLQKVAEGYEDFELPMTYLTGALPPK